MTTVAAASSPLSGWTARGWSKVEVSTIDFRYAVSERYADLEINPVIVAFRDAGWSSHAIKHQFEGASRVLASCGVRIGTATLVTGTPPGGKVEVDMADEPRLLDSTPLDARPLFYLFHQTPLRDTGYSQFGPTCKGPQCSTIWLSSDLLGQEYRSKHRADYNAAAHELVHVLANAAHGDDITHSVMGKDPRKRGTALARDQCDAIRESPLLKPVR